MKPASAPRRLMLLRHGKAVRAEPGEADSDRRLEPRGIADAQKVGRYLMRHQLVPGQVIVSPAARARETWAGVAVNCPAAPPPSYQPRLYEGKAETMLEVLRATAQANDVLLIGHNPGMHDLATLLIASGDVETRERLRENLPTAGLVVIDFAVADWSKLHPHSGRLELFLDPRDLEATVD